jgi:hypothetical protein
MLYNQQTTLKCKTRARETRRRKTKRKGFLHLINLKYIEHMVSSDHINHHLLVILLAAFVVLVAGDYGLL